MKADTRHRPMVRKGTHRGQLLWWKEAAWQAAAAPFVSFLSKSVFKRLTRPVILFVLGHLQIGALIKAF